MLANKNSKKGCLIYPTSEGSKLGELFFSRNLDENPPSHDLPVFSEELDLHSDNEKLPFSEFKEKLKSQIELILDKLLA